MKFEIAAGRPLPDLRTVPGAASVTPPRRLNQVATYYDTPDLALLAAKRTLRRRTGGTDAGWHLKTPGGTSTDGTLLRREYAAPVGSARSGVPGSLRAHVADIVGREALLPIAIMRTLRVRRELRASDGTVLALIEDDSVATSRPAGTQASVWREIEVEILTEDAHVRAGILDAFAAEGMIPSSAPSKLARALAELGLTPGPSVAVPTSVTADPTGERLLVWRYAAAQVGVIQALTEAVRTDAPDAVHKMRVATRRLRATLRTVRPWLDREATQAMRSEVRWLTRALGGARDAEVVRERILRELEELPQRDLRGPVRRRLTRELDAMHAAQHSIAVSALDSARFERLLAALADFLLDLPWQNTRKPRPLADLIAAARGRVQRRAELADLAITAVERDQQLHEVRKKGKAARYAVEAATPREALEAPEASGGAMASATAAAPVLAEDRNDPDESSDLATEAGTVETLTSQLAAAHALDPASGQSDGSAPEEPDELATWVDLQEFLGDRQDAVVARDVVRSLARTARAAGEDTYSYGVIVGRETQRLVDSTHRVEEALRRVLG